MSGGSGDARRDSGHPVLVACLLLTAVLMAVFFVLAWYGHTTHGQVAVRAALLAVGVNWAAGLAALLLIGVFRNSQWAIHGVLGAMLVRLGLPLAVALFLFRAGGPLVNAGVLGMIVLCYLLGLFVETLLAAKLAAVAAAGPILRVRGGSGTSSSRGIDRSSR